MKCCKLFAGSLLLVPLVLKGVEISRIDQSGKLSWTGAHPVGICSLETVNYVTGPWSPQANVFTTGSGEMFIGPNELKRFFRLASVDISSNAPDAFANLTASYGVIETIAGT